MKDALKRLFENTAPRTQYLIVSKRLSATRYELVDDTGQVSYAESVNFYPVGTPVVVRDKEVVHAGGREGKPRVYEV